MKTLLTLVLGLSALIFSVRAQDTDTPLQAIPPFLSTTNISALSLDEAQDMLDTIEALPLIPATEQSSNSFAALYWSASHLEWPPLPANVQGLDGWPLDDAGQSFLLNDFDAEDEHPLMHRMDDLTPPDFGGDTNSFGGESFGALFSSQIFTNGLWLEMISAGPPTNGPANLILHGTTNDVTYEILSRQDLLDTNWISETVILGTTNQDWTPFSVLEGNRTNAFFWARSLISSDGSGLPDYWESENGVTDPYGDPDGDGWNNLQEYQNGTDPHHFDTPPTPTGLTFAYSNNAVIISWDPSPGNVTGYTIQIYDPVTDTFESHNVSAGITTYVAYNPPSSVSTVALSGWWPPTPEFNAARANVVVHRENAGTTIDSTATKNFILTNSLVDGMIVRGQLGHAYLAVSAVPPNAMAIRLVQARQYAGETMTFTNLMDIPVSAFTNGLHELPSDFIPAFTLTTFMRWYVKIVDANGREGESTLAADGYGLNYVQTPFLDAREHLKQNLAFLLRAGDTQFPFGFLWEKMFRRDISDYDDLFSTGYSYGSYMYAGMFDNNGLDEFRPFIDNYLFNNFGATSSALDTNGFLNTGVESYPILDYPSASLLSFPLTGSPIPAVASSNDVEWIYFDQYPDYLPLTSDTGTNYTMVGDVRNFFGLKFRSIKITTRTSSLQTWILHQNESAPAYSSPTYFYPETEEPDLQTVGHYFAERDYNRTDPAPGDASFSPTNTTPLMIVPFGFSRNNGNFSHESPYTFAGYAKQEIENGYEGAYGYLGLYFDKAYLCDDSGNVTTNETGILSPYGEFVATMPGTVAMVTMPENADDTGPRGTNIVHVIKLQLDVNHDGNMDLSLAGPDNTTQDRPFTFWVNNDNDGVGIGHDIPVLTNATVADYSFGRIRSLRNLEDFARLWLVGLPTLTGFGDYHITLSWRNVTGTPVINIYTAADANGGIGYLTNTNSANDQAFSALGYDSKLGTVSNTLEIPDTYFFPHRVKNCFLFEGAGVGKGELVLTISKDGQTLAETSQWLDLHDVKDFYESAHSINVTTEFPPSELLSDCETLSTTEGLPDETKQIILHVHGINVNYLQWQIEAQTIFKRLYWSGFHGRFASFRWSCAYLPFENTFNPFNYNLGEFYAYKSARALKKYMDLLQARPDLVGYTFNILAHSQGNVITSEAISEGAHFDNYILSQASVPAHCYDTNAPFLQKLLDADTANPTPLYVTNGGYHGYFENLSNSGKLIDFANTNDFALVSGTYFGHQANWEADQETQKPEDFSSQHGQRYIYSPTNFTSTAYYPFTGYTVMDPQEIRALIARSRSRAAGAQTGLNGAISGTIDLKASFGFDVSRDEHSAQITRAVQTVWQYYDQVLRSFQIQTINR